MSIDKIKRIRIAVHRKQKIALLNVIYNLEAVHIDDFEGFEQLDSSDVLEDIERDDRKKYKNKIQRVNSALAFLSRYQKPEGLIQSFFPSKLFIDKETLEEIKNGFNMDAYIHDILKINEEENKLKREQSRLETLLHELNPYLFIGDRIKDIKDTGSARVKIGLVSRQDFAGFSEKAGKILPAVLKYNEYNPKDVFIFLVYHRNAQKEVDELFSGITFIEHSFSKQLCESPQKEHSDISEKLKAIEKRLSKLYENGDRMSRDADKLKVFYDLLNSSLDIYVVQESAKGTKSSVFLNGWIRERDIQDFEKAIAGFKEIHVDYREPEEKDEDIPVALSTPRVLKPFQMVLKLYAMPRFFEVDPTFILAPFFALFFALCLTDAGYGLLLVLLSLLLYKSRKVEKGSELLFKLMIFSGLLTIIAGILTGGFMGYSLQGIPVLNRLILLDLNSEAVDAAEPPSITFLKIALLLGIIHVITGISIRGYMKIRDRHVFSAVVDELNQILLIVFGSIYVGNFLSFINIEEGSAILTVSGYGMLITSLIFILFIGRELRKPLPVVGKGLFEYYSFFSGTFGDVLSYARLMALGMATGVTAKSVGMISAMVFDIKIIGPVIAILIFVVGHLFMMIINALGSFIHTARLQYLEFFTKFYEGGGREFKPFKHEKRYIVFEKDLA